MPSLVRLALIVLAVGLAIGVILTVAVWWSDRPRKRPENAGPDWRR